MLIWWRLKTFTTDSRRRTTWAESRSPHVRPVSRLHPREFLIMQKRHQLIRPSVLLFVLTLLAAAAQAQWAPMNPVTAVQQQPDGVLFTMQTGTLKLQVCTDSIIRVRYSATSTFSDRPDYVITKTSWPETKWTMQSTDDAVTLTTSRLAVTVTRKDGGITYRDLAGKQLLQEATRKLTPVKVNGEDTYRAESFINIYGSHEGPLRAGPAPGGRVELSRRVGRHLPGQHQHRRPAAGFEQGIRHLLEQHVAQPVQQPLRELPVHQLRSCRRHRLLLFLRARIRQDRRRLPRTDRAGSHVRQMGLRILAMQEPLQVAGRNSGSRARSIASCIFPVDNIVQDWFWWNRKGEHVFNKNYPDPKGMVDQLHSENFHLMISVWPFFEPGSAVYDDMEKQGMVRRQIQIRQAALSTPMAWPCTTRPIPRPANITGS